MGTLDCRYPADQGTLRCLGRRPDDVWSFTVSQDSMTGTLTIGTDKKVYRRASLARAAD